MPKILIVEDEDSIRRVLRNILSEENSSWEIDDAQDGVEAIEKLSKNYDLVLCDIKMPKADGIEVLNFAREHFPDTSIVMISGHADLDTAVECMRKGAYDFISKPPDLNRFIQTVRNALDRNQLEPK